MKSALRLVPLLVPFLALIACGDGNDDDFDTIEGAKKVKPSSVDPDMRGYFLLNLPNASEPIAKAKYYLDEDSITPGTPFLVALTTMAEVTKQFRICYDGAKELCTPTPVKLTRKRTTEFTAALLSVKVNAPTVATLPPPPPADFGPAGVLRNAVTSSQVTVNLPGLVLASTDATLLPSVKNALDGSATTYLPALTTANWSAAATGAALETAPVTDGYVSRTSFKIYSASASTPTVVSIEPPARENPNAFAQTYELILCGAQTGPAATEDSVWGPDHSSTTGITLAAGFAYDVVMRAKSLSTTSPSALKVFSPSHGQYAFVLNKRQIVYGTTVEIERIDVDHPVVTDEATGATYTAKGKWQLLTPTGVAVYDGEFDTGTGVDVLVGSTYLPGSTTNAADRTYLVRTRFTSSSGPQLQTQTITF